MPGAEPEFIQFLLSHGDRDRALSELLALKANWARTRGLQFEVARMLLQAGDPTRALAHFERVLQASPGDQLALAGAGEASFERGDYARAQRYLHAVTAGMGPNEGAPHAHRSRHRRRSARAAPPGGRAKPAPGGRALAYDRAAGWLSHTQSSASFERRFALVLEDARTLNTTLGASGSTTAEQIETGFDTVWHQVRVWPKRVCGSPDPLDRALLLIARRHGARQR